MDVLHETEGPGLVVEPGHRVAVLEGVLQAVQVLARVLTHLLKPANNDVTQGVTPCSSFICSFRTCKSTCY